MDYRKALKIRTVISLIGLGIMFFSFLYIGNPTVLFVLVFTAIALVFIGLIILYVFFRCPQCAGHLIVIFNKTTEFCPHCGHKLE